jgi:hypothetical protein
MKYAHEFSLHPSSSTPSTTWAQWLLNMAEGLTFLYITRIITRWTAVSINLITLYTKEHVSFTSIQWMGQDYKVFYINIQDKFTHNSFSKREHHIAHLTSQDVVILMATRSHLVLIKSMTLSKWSTSWKRSFILTNSYYGADLWVLWLPLSTHNTAMISQKLFSHIKKSKLSDWYSTPHSRVFPNCWYKSDIHRPKYRGS